MGAIVKIHTGWDKAPRYLQLDLDEGFSHRPTRNLLGLEILPNEPLEVKAKADVHLNLGTILPTNYNAVVSINPLLLQAVRNVSVANILEPNEKSVLTLSFRTVEELNFSEPLVRIHLLD